MTNRLPNILITMCDDQRHAALGCCEEATRDPVRTPHLDRLAARGRRFTHAYHAGSATGAVCAPSRAMLHSGRGPFSIPRGMASNPLGDAYCTDDDPPLLGELLRQAGYRTYMVGKWHNDQDRLRRSFDEGHVFVGGMGDHYNLPMTHFAGDGPMTRIIAHGDHSTDVFATAARVCIKQHVEQEPDRPFLLVVAFTAPHDPRHTHAAWHDRYPAADIDLPPNCYAEHPFDNGSLNIRDELLSPRPRVDAQTRHDMADYFALTEHMDHGVGWIHAAIDDAGLTDRTLFVHTADHGLAVGQHGLMGKQNMYDHSVRVPLLVAGPSVQPGTSGTPVYQHDLYPTLLEAAGLDDHGSPFISLSHELGGGSDRDRWVGSFYAREQRMVTDGKTKLMRVIGPDGSIQRRFNLVEDPFETKPLGEPPTPAELEALDAWMKDHADPEAQRFGASFES